MTGRRTGGPPSYECRDRSLLRPAATRIYFSRIFRLLPGWLTANFVTLGAFGSTLAVLAFAAGAPDASPALLALVYFVGTQLYVAGDHLDGMQALASRTTSPLGEFLDHFLDSFSGAILALAAVTLLPSPPGWLLPLLLWLYWAAFVATYVERVERRELHFHRVGSLEGIVILSLFFGSSVLPAGRAFWSAPLVGGLAPWWLLVAVAVAIPAGTVVAVLRRLGRTPAGFLSYALAAGVAAAALSLAPDALRVPGWLLLTLHGAEYLARVMQPQIFGREPRPDAVAPVAAALAGGLWLVEGSTTWRAGGSAAGSVAEAVVPVQGAAGGWAAVAVAAATVWLAARAAVTVARVLQALGDHWIWVNPRPEEAAGD